MFNLSNIFSPSHSNVRLNRDQIVQLLKTRPEALDAFESAYTCRPIEDGTDNLFEINSRQASQMRKAEAGKTDTDMHADADRIRHRAVEELLAQTRVYSYENHTADYTAYPCLPDGTTLVSNADINKLPASLRLQATGALMQRDIGSESAPVVLWHYAEMQKTKNTKKAKYMYDHFRQGLDILDLDPLMYEIIDQNPNSMSHWLPALVDACANQSFFKIPETKIAKVPMNLLQLTRLDYPNITPATMQMVNEWAQQAFELDETKKYFIKTGTFSSKFDFRNAKVADPKEISEIGEYLLFIHFQALQMASPLAQPCIYGAGTTTEWVVREYIEDKENNPCIYHGMPLHTEYRIFIDCDTNQVIGQSPYWEPETMKTRFAQGADKNNPDYMHDYVTYSIHEETLMRRYHENVQTVVDHVEQILPRLNLKGQWSLDIMQNGDDFWLIDMGRAENSAFYNCVPAELRLPSAENWLPQIPDET